MYIKFAFFSSNLLAVQQQQRTHSTFIEIKKHGEQEKYENLNQNKNVFIRNFRNIISSSYNVYSYCQSFNILFGIPLNGCFSMLSWSWSGNLFIVIAFQHSPSS